VGPRVGLDAVEKRRKLHCWESNPDCTVRSPSLYRMISPDSSIIVQEVTIKYRKIRERVIEILHHLSGIMLKVHTNFAEILDNFVLSYDFLK
jgi:hypothetical protein